MRQYNNFCAFAKGVMLVKVNIILVVYFCDLDLAKQQQQQQQYGGTIINRVHLLT